MKDHGEPPSGQGPGEEPCHEPGGEPRVDGALPVDAEEEPRLAALLAALSAPGETHALPGEQEALAAFRAHAPTPPTPSRRPRMLAHLTAAKVAAAALSGGLVLTGGTAAATGTLPGPAQQTAKDVLGTVGVEVPGPDDAAGTHPGGESADGAGAGTGTTGKDKGEEVSDVATTTEETGRDKGAEVADTASDGKSRVGEEADGPADTAEEHAPQGAGDAADTAGEAGETVGDTAGEAGDTARDRAETGTSTADGARDGGADARSTGEDAAAEAGDATDEAGADQAGR